MNLIVTCTDCGHERVVSGVDTGGLPLDRLILETHSCECFRRCEDCEDMQELEEFRKEVVKLKLQLKGVHCELKDARNELEGRAPFV